MAAGTLNKYATADQTVGNLIPSSELVTAIQNKTPISFGMSLQKLFGCSNGKPLSTVDPRP